MRKLSTALCAALAFSFVGSTAMPLAAAPAFIPRAPVASTDVVDVQQRVGRDRQLRNRNGQRTGRFERRGGRYYLNGKRGYNQRRAGYRQHQGYWFPPSAFIAGAIIGGALNNQPTVRRGGSAHVRWCADRWQSYRAYDNSYQPYNGPRRTCTSPYG